MIRTRDLQLRREERVLVQAATFQVSSGELHAITGPNGSGKSTLLAALAGDFAPAAGEIYLDGNLLSSLSDYEQARKRAVLSQTPVLFPYTPRQLLDLVADQRSRLELPQPSVAVDLASFMDTPVTHLSGGERARTMLAATIAQGARTLLLDEPTAAFDRYHRDWFLDLVDQLTDAQYSLIVVTHDEKIEERATSVTELK